MDPQSANLAILEGTLQIRMGRGGGIERYAVVFDDNLEQTVLAFTGDVDMVLFLVLEAMGNDVGKQLIQGQVDLEGLAFGDPTILAKLPEMVTQGVQLRQAVF